MSILVNKKTRLVVQGITGGEGTFHTQQMIEYGTNVVAGVTPGKGGMIYRGNEQYGFKKSVPVFNTVADAVHEQGADVSVIFVPAGFAAEAIMESAAAGIELVVAITEGIPGRATWSRSSTTSARPVPGLIGPNCPGIITPGECKIGIMPGFIHRPGRVGIISRSGTLTYEAVWQVSELGLGQSTCIGIGGDPIIGTKFIDALRLFNEDDATDAVIMIGEIGGSAEEEAVGIHQEAFPKAGRRLHRRQDRAPGQEDGPRGRHHLRRQRDGGRKDGRHARCGDQGCREPRADRRSYREDPPEEDRCRSKEECRGEEGQRGQAVCDGKEEPPCRRETPHVREAETLEEYHMARRPSCERHRTAAIAGLTSDVTQRTHNTLNNLERTHPWHSNARSRFSNPTPSGAISWVRSLPGSRRPDSGSSP